MYTMTKPTEFVLTEAPVAAWTPEALKQVSDSLEGHSPEDILRWGIENFTPDLVQASSFGPEGIVLMHLLSEMKAATPVFYLDTDLLFPETYELRDQLAVRFGKEFVRVSTDLSVEAQAEKHGPALWSREPNLCCQIRKVEPLRRYLSDKRAWITGIRRDQTATRANAGLVEWDRSNGLVKLNPLAAWTAEDVWAHIHSWELPFNKLHLQNYPSIGCWPCTRPVAPGDDPRAGRWAGLAKTECGIHLQPKAK